MTRAAHPWTRPPITYRLVANDARAKKCGVLDFGCGAGYYTDWLREQGISAAGHDRDRPLPADQRYAVVIASNVINVQETVVELLNTLRQIRKRMNPRRDPIGYISYPTRPRYLDLSPNHMRGFVERFFNIVATHRSGGGTQVWKVKPLEESDETEKV